LDGHPTKKGRTVTDVQVIARYTIAPGNEEAVLALLRELAAAARTEPGNLAFEVAALVGDPRQVVLLERYVSRAAFEDHRTTPHFKRLVLEQIVPLLDSRAVELFDAGE
jgi:quinol monooxygenase YgiN